MTVAELLLDCLEQLKKEDLEKFKWYLTMQKLEGFKSIPQSYLENAERTKTVTKMIENYTEDVAVTVAVTVLKKQQMNDLALKLSKAHQEKLSTVSFTTSASETVPGASHAAVPPAAVAAPPAAAAAAAPPACPSLVAQEGSVIIAPNITSSKPGTWNITISKN